MSIFGNIAAQWSEISSPIEQRLLDACNSNDDAAFEAVVRDQSLSDTAYFLLLFVKFEAEVNKGFDLVLSNRTVAGTWEDTRSWRAWEGKKTKDIEFMIRVGMLLQKGNSDWNKVNEYYKIRNALAHGDSSSSTFFIPQVAIDLERIQSGFITT